MRALGGRRLPRRLGSMGDHRHRDDEPDPTSTPELRWQLFRVRRHVGWARTQGLGRLIEEDQLDPFERIPAAIRRAWWRRQHDSRPNAVPVFIVGVQRSGTNMLHERLRTSAGVRGPQRERPGGVRPIPAQEPARHPGDRRAEQACVRPVQAPVRLPPDHRAPRCPEHTKQRPCHLGLSGLPRVGFVPASRSSVIRTAGSPSDRGRHRLTPVAGRWSQRGEPRADRAVRLRSDDAGVGGGPVLVREEFALFRSRARSASGRRARVLRVHDRATRGGDACALLLPRSPVP